MSVTNSNKDILRPLKILLLIETSASYGRDILRGVAEYAKWRGSWVLYIHPGSLGELKIHWSDWQMDGVIARDSEDPSEQGYRIPTVLISTGSKDTRPPFIDSNQQEIGRMGARHLLDQGFRHVAFFGYSDRLWSVERRISFQKEVKQARQESHIYEKPFSAIDQEWSRQEKEFTDWLRQMPKPLGIMACEDALGKNVIEACKELYLNVPNHVSVLGVDNDEFFCNLCAPSLSSIALSVEKSGFDAAEMLDRIIRGEQIENKIIRHEPTQVVVRQSTNTLAIEDRHVAKAVRYIRQHSHEPMQVSDIVQQVNISRRSLYDRFKNAMGRSIYDEIRRARVEQISNMLINTNLSVSQIASLLGFSGVNRISRYFRDQKKVSPYTYRNKFMIRPAENLASEKL